MAQPRKIKSESELSKAWEAYKAACDNKSVLTHEFNSKTGTHVSEELRRSITYTIEGFCVFLGLARQNFYVTYAEDEAYRDIVTRIREECEVDARTKFELGVIPSQLSGLWMSKHGYSTKTDNTVKVDDVRPSSLEKLTVDELRRLAALEETEDSESGET